jgi:DNA-binding MarR family transcriptional regulator
MARSRDRRVRRVAQAEDGPVARIAEPEALDRFDADLMRPLLKLSNLFGRPFFSHFAERYDLTRNDVRVLMTVADMSEAAAHEVSRSTGMHPMNVSRSVARLRRQGRIAERSDPSNRRRKILTPTAAGWDLTARLRPHIKVVSQFLFASLSEPEAEVLSRLVGRLVERLESVDLSSGDMLDAEALALDVRTDLEASADEPQRVRPAFGRSRRPLSAGRRASQRPGG